MFENRYEQRLESWSKFREELETSLDPLQDLVDFYRQAPYVSIHTDPWDQSSWPGPWDLVFENQYDDFCRVLGMCYSLQLTERFKRSSFEIHICTINSLGCLYLLYVDEYVLGYEDDKPVKKHELPDDICSQQVYAMTKSH